MVAFCVGAAAHRGLGLGGDVCFVLPLGRRSLMDGWLWHIARCYGWQQGSGDGVRSALLSDHNNKNM